jgi:hypothetical protein
MCPALMAQACAQKARLLLRYIKSRMRPRDTIAYDPHIQ